MLSVGYGGSLFPKAEKREIDHTHHSVYTRELVGESGLACCLLSDSRFQSLLESQVPKRALTKREVVEESELTCCKLSDSRCQALLD